MKLRSIFFNLFLSPRLKVTDECPMQVAVVRKFFLRLKATLNSNFPDVVSQAPKNLVHSQSIRDRLSIVLQLLH
jgi:hypothetical protein